MAGEMARADRRRQRLGCGRPYRAEVVMRAGELMEGTSLPFKVIAAALGIGTTTLHRWWKRHEWVRPARAPRSGQGAPGWAATPFRSRRRGKRHYADTIEAVRVLVMGTLLPQTEIARRVGVSQERVSFWARRRGWHRPPVPSQVGPARFAHFGRPGTPEFGGATRFAASGRKGRLAAEGDRRGRPYAPEVRRQARVLWEETRLSTALIGARLGVHPVTVSRWAREDGWERPRGRTGARQLRGFFGSQRRRPAGSGPPRIRLL